MLGVGLSLSEVSTRVRDGAAPAPSPAPPPPPPPPPPPAALTLTKLVAEGDSITYDQGSPPESYARAWKTANSAAVTTTISSNVGSGIGASGDAAGSNSMYGRKGGVISAAPQVETVLIGANDLVNGYAGEAAWRSALYGYIAYMKAQLPGLVVGVAGLMPQDAARSSVTGADLTEFNTRAAAACANLRAAIGSQIEFYIPFGDAMDAAWTADVNNLYDGLHAGNNGKRLIGAIYAAVMDPILAKAAGTNPAAYSVIDQNNAAASSYREQSFIVTGLGLGQTATFTASNGQVARGRLGSTAFGTGVTAMNGDLVRWRVQASATAGATATSTLAAGSRSATFNVKTVPASGAVGFASGATAYTQSHAAGGDPFNFTNVVFPAGRALVVLDMTYNLSASITMTPSGGGSSVSLAKVGDNGTRQQVWIAPPGTNLAAGNYSVTVTSGYNQDCVLFPAAVQNCSTAAASIVVRKVGFANRPMGDNFSESVLSVPNGAVAVSFGLTEAAGNSTFPDATTERIYATTMDTQQGNNVSVKGAWAVSGASRNPVIAGLIVNDVNYRWTGMTTLLLEP